ncbi:hypothetical protein AURDEDRAFT_113437 [Auricularia subglabra TFB-10046 SS5]|nr:hypothetical protein AURDEDRAFT_113437 [Auricularia subglabra TFB-10046 SS5]
MRRTQAAVLPPAPPPLCAVPRTHRPAVRLSRARAAQFCAAQTASTSAADGHTCCVRRGLTQPSTRATTGAVKGGAPGGACGWREPGADVKGRRRVGIVPDRSDAAGRRVMIRCERAHVTFPALRHSIPPLRLRARVKLVMQGESKMFHVQFGGRQRILHSVGCVHRAR